MKELSVIQSKLNAPKDKYNSFGGYAYRSCEGILQALKPLLTAESCTLTLTDEITSVGERVYVKATATLINAAGEYVQTVAFAREELTKKSMDAAQITGAASSYARKYALNGLFAIDDTKDPDTEEASGMAKREENGILKAKNYISQNQKAFEYYQKLYSHNSTIDDFKDSELLWIYNDLIKKGVKL